MRNPSPSELRAFAAIERAYGGSVEPWDVPPRQGAVDGMLRLPASASEAIEVSTLADPAAVQVESLLAKDDFNWQIKGLAWWWTVAVSPQADLKLLRRQLPDLLRAFEKAGTTHVSYLRLPWRETEIGAALNRGDFDAFGHPSVASRAGEVEITPKGHGGAAGGTSVVNNWIEEVLAEDEVVASKLAKLATCGCEIQHLFLYVRPDRVPFAVFYPLAFGGDPPESGPDIGALTSLWLAPTVGSRLWVASDERWDLRSFDDATNLEVSD